MNLKNLLNLKAWSETFVSKMLMTKAVKHATAVVIGLFSSVVFTTKIKPVLDHWGFSIDTTHLAESLTIFFSGVAGSLMNWITKTIYHDTDQTKEADVDAKAA